MAGFCGVVVLRTIRSKSPAWFALVTLCSLRLNLKLQSQLLRDLESPRFQEVNSPIDLILDALSRRLRRGPQLQVLGAVVIPHTISMMYLFITSKLSSK